MWHMVRLAIPALIAGNSVIVKPASATPQSALNLEGAFKEAGLPENVFQVVIGDRTTATALIRSPVSVVSLTGSVPTGIAVAREASKGVKKVVLELGGADPFLVGEETDPASPPKGAVAGRVPKTRQTCTAPESVL